MGAPAGSQQVAVVDTILLPAHRGVAVSAVTEQPAVAAAPPVLLGSCASGTCSDDLQIVCLPACSIAACFLTEIESFLTAA